MIVDALEKPGSPAASKALNGNAILANIREMRGMLQARGNEIEEMRRIPEDIVKTMRDAGVFRMMMPRAWGGPEMDPMQINEALEELALGNAAAAWCAMIQMDSGLYSGFLDEGLSRGMFGMLDSAASNVMRPLGRAKKINGGYLVDGRWPFASGCLHADWFAGGCFVYEGEGDQPARDANGAPIHRMILAERKDFIVHDTWYTTGLRGTGSNDVEVRELFVPHEKTFSFAEPSRDSALYAWPPMLCAKMPGVALGMARSAIDTVVAAMRQKKEKSSQVALAVADAETLYASARSYVHASLEALWTRLTADQPPTEQERIAVFLARAHAFQSARTAIQIMFDTLGAASIYGRVSPLDRHLRDINTACQHVVAQRKSQEAAGALALGTLDAPFFLL